MQTGSAVAIGFYGKLPAFGDFITRELHSDFIDPWDTWLQAALAGSRRQLGHAWDETYLTSPLWRYALTPGICGGDARCGVLMPSVDRVGRQFPFTVSARLPVATSLAHLIESASPWFETMEDLLLSLLDRDELSLDQLVDEIRAVDGLTIVSMQPAPAQSAARRLALAAVDNAGNACRALIEQTVSVLIPGHSWWWTAGSECVAPSLLHCAGLPAGERFTAMLDGQWQAGSWTEAGPQPIADVVAGAG